VSASNADRPGVESASPQPSNNPLKISCSGVSNPSPAAAGTDANAIADTSATNASRGPESTHCRAFRAHHGDNSTGTPAAPPTSPVAATDPVSRRITNGNATWVIRIAKSAVPLPASNANASNLAFTPLILGLSPLLR
jgi:hypothetical protein